MYCFSGIKATILIDKKSEADASGFQEIASKNASAFAFQILAKLHPEVKTNQQTIRENSRASDSGKMPQDVLARITAKVTREYPNDFSTQKYLIDQEIQAWQNLYSH